MVAESEVGVSLYLLLGAEAALADRALAKLLVQMREESAELTLLSAPDVVAGDIADALAPSLFSEKRALVLRDLQDLPDVGRLLQKVRRSHLPGDLRKVFPPRHEQDGDVLLARVV